MDIVIPKMITLSVRVTQPWCTDANDPLAHLRVTICCLAQFMPVRTNAAANCIVNRCERPLEMSQVPMNHPAYCTRLPRSRERTARVPSPESDEWVGPDRLKW